jgi:hypothetical protein
MNFDDLDTDPMTAVTGASKARAASAETFPCVRCGGTGQYRGYRVNQPATECFSCGGRGYHKQAPHVRVAANAKRKATMAKKRTDGIVAFLTEHAKLYEWLHENKHWYGFAGSLAQQLTEKGKLSEKQIEAAYAAMARHAEKEAAKAAAKEQAKADAPKVDISVIAALFDHAKDNGLKRPKLNAYGVVISEAPAHGANAGALYVKHNGEYAGKIKGGKFMATNAATDETIRVVNALAADPKGFSAQAGKDTGICCCCSRELTDPESIKAGIGPICASKWF